MKISSPAKLSSYFAKGSIKLQYTSYCFDFHVYVESNDFIYLLTTGSTNALYTSQSPYTQLLEFALSTPFKVLKILGIVNDVTKSSEVLLLKVLVNQVGVKIKTNSVLFSANYRRVFSIITGGKICCFGNVTRF